jgi:hypothetical protein
VTFFIVAATPEGLTSKLPLNKDAGLADRGRFKGAGVWEASSESAV